MAEPDRTEAPTGKRLADARRKGNVARSQDVTTAAVLATALLMVRFRWEAMGQDLSTLMTKHLGHFPTRDLDIASLGQLVMDDGLLIIRLTAPIALALLAVGVFSSYLQVGNLITFESLKPDIGKLNPMGGLKRLFFSAQAMVELGKNLLKLTVLSAIVWQILRDRYPIILGGLRMQPQALAPVLGDTAWQMTSRLVLALVVVAVADYAWQRYNYFRSLRMTKQEIKDENKQQEGSPEVKSEIKRRMREGARRRMMQQVPKATVVITNPTHYAVALSYDRDTMPTPMVVAKGQDLVALRIRSIAEEHHIPVVENPPVARELYRLVDLGDLIPPVLYTAIAEILVAIAKATPEKIVW